MLEGEKNSTGKCRLQNVYYRRKIKAYEWLFL